MMKVIGIILLVIGVISTLGGIFATISGRGLNLSGLTFVVLGAYLIHRANQKKADAEEKKQFEAEDVDKE